MRADAENDGAVHRQKPERLPLDPKPERVAGILGGDGRVMLFALMATGLEERGLLMDRPVEADG